MNATACIFEANIIVLYVIQIVIHVSSQLIIPACFSKMCGLWNYSHDAEECEFSLYMYLFVILIIVTGFDMLCLRNMFIDKWTIPMFQLMMQNNALILEWKK